MIDIFSYTSQGGRAYNEDSVGYVHTDDGAILIVADGLGGHQGGEVASQLAVRSMLSEPLGGAGSDMEWLQSRLESANDAILGQQAANANKMKSTIVALKISGDQATWAHLGDSRLYYIHHSAIAAVTEDHSVAYKKYKAGEILRSQIATDEDQSSLLRSLGNKGSFKPDFGMTQEPLIPGDGFLLCSDGFWEYLQEQEIVFDYLKAGNARMWAELLLLRVIERVPGNHDNLSAVTAFIQ